MTLTAPRPPEPRLVGRRHEMAALTALVERMVGGRGGSLAIVGPPGSGKTVLLDWLAGEAVERGFAVSRTTGAESEADLPWAGLASICLERVGLFDRLPGPQGRALRNALAMGEGERGIDRLAVSLGALGVLSAVGREAPLVVIVDDLQWLDPESRRAIEFLARRLDDDSVVLVTASRPRSDRSSSGALVLGGLGPKAMGELLEGHGVQAPGAQEIITDLADGSPLLALQLADSLDADERSGVRPLPDSLPVPPEVSALYLARLDGLDAAARQALAVVAADASSDGGALADALRSLGLAIADLELAEERGLVAVEGGRVRFTHPLARTAVYQGVPGPVRRRAHSALAQAEGHDQPRGILHRAAAAVGPDPSLALALAGLADEAQRRGAPLIAARRGADAAALTNDVVRRAELLVGAAQAALVGGEVRRAAELIAAAREADADRVSRLDARRVVVRLLVAAGDIDGARQQVEALDLAYGDTDPVATAKLLSEVARPLLAVAPFVAAPFTERVWELAASAGGSAALYAEVLYGCGRFVQGDLEGASQHTAVWPELLRLEGAVAAGSFLAETVVLYQGFSYQVGAALRLLDEIEGQIRRHCATGALVSVLVARSLISYGVDLRECVAAGREALLLSAETGQTGLTSVAETTLAIASATVGDEALTDEVCERLLATGETRHEVWARAALGRLHLVAGRPEAAVAQFALLRERAGGQNTSFAQFEADEAEAFVRVGRIDDARALVPVLADYAGAMGPWAVGMHQRVLALVADDIDEANAHFRAAQAALAETDNRIAQGIVELSWGERLRRAKRRAEARRRLERAVELFGRVGATAFRRRAEAELAAAGGGGDRSRPTIELLGATELQMARLAVGGATNRDIASQLFVSPRTVENHLGAVYRKLGVAGRPGLLSRAVEDPTLHPVVHDAP